MVTDQPSMKGGRDSNNDNRQAQLLENFKTRDVLR